MTTINLYSAANTLTTLLDSGIDEDGVISPELESALVQFEGKGAAVVAYILANRAQIEMGKAAIKKAQERLKAEESRIERLERYLADNMKRCGITSIESSDKTFGAKLYTDRDEYVDVFEPATVPQEYLREIPAKYEPDKTLIKQALNDGFDVPGAVIRKKDRLVIK